MGLYSVKEKDEKQNLELYESCEADMMKFCIRLFEIYSFILSVWPVLLDSLHTSMKNVS